MKVFLASVESTGTFRKNMKMYLAESGGMWEAYFVEKYFKDAYILQSFYYADDFTEKYIIPNVADFLLDSGAFTFIRNAKTHINWDEYVERYADFINRNNVEKYFELDIDFVVGYKQVLRYRDKLEKLTGRQCIPVWHKSRGINEYYKHCQEYPYVGIGGYVIKELTPSEFKAFPHMIYYAHKNKTKVHCLGFTRLKDLKKYHFDSVDSTAWTAGNRFGFIYKFNGETMVKYNTPEGMRLADSKKVALNNYTEWLKFQQYAERCL